MYIEDIAKIIYAPNTASENLQVTIFTNTRGRKKLWEGKAIDLKDSDFIKKEKGWIVCEILRDNRECFSHIPKYNRPYIIYVI